MACVSATRAKQARCVQTSVTPQSRRMQVNMGGALTLYSIQRCGTRRCKLTAADNLQNGAWGDRSGLRYEGNAPL
jgi:hypothetical protein